METHNVCNQGPEILEDYTIAEVLEVDPLIEWDPLIEKSQVVLEVISNRLGREKFYPRRYDMFNAFHITPLESTRVVILGQDPYHGPGEAHGFAFSVPIGVRIPPTLRNIFKELRDEIKDFEIPKNGCLVPWATQGVLLLNASLTVRPGSPNSHKGYWTPFIEKVFESIHEVNPNCIYVLWGGDAQKFIPKIGKGAVILKTSHPSYFSAKKGFFGSNHFNLINEALIKQGKEPIEWKL